MYSPSESGYISVPPKVDDEDRQARFWRRRPDGFAVNEKEHIIYILEFKRVLDTGERYVSEDTHWIVEQLSFVEGHKSVSASV